jgi:hypothetical protein
MICPVPEEQQPLNEYLAIKGAFLYRWATLEGWQLYRLLLGIWLAFWLSGGTSGSIELSRLHAI